MAQTFTPPAEIRHDTSLVDSWRFIKNDVTGAEQENFNDESWTVISIPHTWNAQDGQDGGNDYLRGIGFYRRHFSIDASEAGRQLFIHFDGVNTVTASPIRICGKAATIRTSTRRIRLFRRAAKRVT
jgi:beta-galactosidase